jgi:hypothetical protein
MAGASGECSQPSVNGAPPDSVTLIVMVAIAMLWTLATIAGGVLAGVRHEHGVNRGVVWSAVGVAVALLVVLAVAMQRRVRRLP